MAIKIRSNLYCKWKSDPSTSNWEFFKIARNKVHTITKKAKCIYYQTQFGNDISNKDFWKNLRKIGIKKKSNECNFDPQTMINLFSNPNTENNLTSFQLKPDLIFDGNKLNLISFSESEVYNSILSIQSNAVGHDCIHMKFVKLILPFVLSTITHIFNHVLTTNIFPAMWKIAQIVPVAKKSAPTAPNEFRPISILSSLSKAFEKLVSLQMLKHITNNKLLSRYQSGFQNGKSCNTAVLRVSEDIRPNYDKGDITILVLIDFSKAFDSVDHEILLDKLFYYFGFSKNTCMLLKSYLTDRSQYVSLNNNSSNMERIYSGVPQGSILGPLLFSIFINDIVSCCKNSSIHLYADDVQIYLSRPSGLIEDLTFRLNDDLACIFKWSEENKLLINVAKTQAIHICHKVPAVMIPMLIMNEASISYSVEVKSLGFVINSKFNCISHINATVQKIYSVLRKLWCIASFLQPEVKLRLVKIYIVPFIIYGSKGLWKSRLGIYEKTATSNQ